jgi:hypothetical protein
LNAARYSSPSSSPFFCFLFSCSGRTGGGAARRRGGGARQRAALGAPAHHANTQGQGLLQAFGGARLDVRGQHQHAEAHERRHLSAQLALLVRAARRARAPARHATALGAAQGGVQASRPLAARALALARTGGHQQRVRRQQLAAAALHAARRARAAHGHDGAIRPEHRRNRHIHIRGGVRQLRARRLARVNEATQRV